MVSHHEKSYGEEGNHVLHKIISIGVCRNLSRTIVTIANQNMGLKIKNCVTLYSGSRIFCMWTATSPPNRPMVFVSCFIK